MKNNWLFFTKLDLNGGRPDNCPSDFQLPQGFRFNMLAQFNSLAHSYLYNSNHVYTSGNLALQETFSFISKFAGALFVWLCTGSNSNILRKQSESVHGSNSRSCHSCNQVKNATYCTDNLAGLPFGSLSNGYIAIPKFIAKLAHSAVRHLWKELEQQNAFPVLSLAAALIPPFDNLSSKVLADSIPLENADERINGPTDRSPSEDNYRGCASLAISNITWEREATEPKTGIKFPTFLEYDSKLTTEVLVGTGSRSMRVIRLKSLKIYAFGLYVRPDSVCERLGRKYGSVPISELQNCSEFFEDLLREDIHMTVRLVVNCNGLKINNVRDAFEKSLRTRLQKMNPNTDYHCLRAFGSYFTHDIPLPMGTTIDFRQTVDGQLITEIGGKHIGAVHSKDLCRAFFDMYIGDVPVSVQAKQEIAHNVADLVRRC